MTHTAECLALNKPLLFNTGTVLLPLPLQMLSPLTNKLLNESRHALRQAFTFIRDYFDGTPTRSSSAHKGGFMEAITLLALILQYTVRTCQQTFIHIFDYFCSGSFFPGWVQAPWFQKGAILMINPMQWLNFRQPRDAFNSLRLFFSHFNTTMAPMHKHRSVRERFRDELYRRL